jgi:hypothetical protein
MKDPRSFFIKTADNFIRNKNYLEIYQKVLLKKLFLEIPILHGKLPLSSLARIIFSKIDRYR